jgi:hypothetical protein
MTNPVLTRNTTALRGTGATVQGIALITLLYLGFVVSAAMMAWQHPELFAPHIIVLSFAGLGVGLLISYFPKRASLLGPVYAILEGFLIGVYSMLLETRYPGIVMQAATCTFGIAFACVEEIEEHNILNATYLAMNRAIAKLDPQPALALIDGNRSTGITVQNRCIVKGDARCADIAAASVLAKVSRDRYMLEMASLYPQYHFEQHKGYGTKLHYAAIREYGPCPIHRMSFLKKLYG